MHLGWILLSGTALLAMAILPRLLASRPMSLPMLYVAFGAAVFWIVDPLHGPDPATSSLDNAIVLYGSELVVIVSLATVGLSIERRPGAVSWGSVWRLLAVTMTLCVLAMTLLGMAVLALPFAAALLLGAVLAPTDPVLADDVQVSAPGEDHDRDEVRFTLTAEAGLNDSLAFPVTYLAIAVAGSSFADAWARWVLVDVGYRIVVGTLCGAALGWVLTMVARRWHATIVTSSGVGVFILGATLVVYGVTEVFEGYGFLAVFVAALTRHDEVEDLREQLHGFSEQFESMLIAFALVWLGAGIAEGVLAPTTPAMVAVAALLLLVVRPVAGWIGLIGATPSTKERLAIGFLGIRGIGSLYYLAYAAASDSFDAATLADLWAVVALVVLGSVALHGTSAPWIMRHLDSAPGGIRTHESSD